MILSQAGTMYDLTIFDSSCSSSADQTKIVIAERGGVVSEGPEY